MITNSLAELGVKNEALFGKVKEILMKRGQNNDPN
jgi:hypothetical protein